MPSRTLPPPAPETQIGKLSRTGKALVAAAKHMISSGRLESATIEEIAREANVAKRSFHNHFRDREALIDHVLSEVRAELEAAIAAVNEGVDDPAVRFTRGMLASFRYSLENRVGARAMMHVSAGAADPAAPRNRQLAQDLGNSIARGELKLAHVDTGVVLILGLSNLGVSRLLPLHDQRPQAWQLMRHICVLLLRGLGVDGRRIERVVDDAMRVVFGAEAAQRNTP